MGEKIVDIKVNQDLGDGVEKIETQSQAGDKFKTTMAEAADTMKDLPGFERYQTTANASWNAASDRLMNAAKQVVHDPYATKYETGRRQADFRFQQDVLSATYNDLQKTAEAASKLSQAIGKHNGLKDLMTRTFPSMLTMASNAMKLFEGSHKSLGNTSLMHSHFVRQMKEAAEENPHSDMGKLVTLLRGSGSKADDITWKKNAKDIWDYVFQVSSPQHRRASFMDKMSKDTSIDGTRYRSFRESLPTSFAKLPVRHTQMIADKDWKQRYATDVERIQEKELEFLQARIMKNRVLMDAAVASGIAVKSKGRLLMNTNMPLRGQVNMMGGQVMEFMENALRGMPMYGITDIENPDNWAKLERKNNSRYRMAREAMEVLDEFAWFDPTYYTKTQARNLRRAAGSKFHPATASAPVINHSPLYTAFEVPAYKIGDNGNLVEDAHLAIEDSIAMRAIRKHSDRDRAKTHNSLMEDTVYVNIDERLGDPQLGEYDRQALLDKYANQVDNGFTPAGAKEKYVFVGVSKDSGIQFVRQSVKEKAEKANPGIFTGSHITTDVNGNIIPQTEYDSYTAFAGVLDGSRKNNTPGEDARNLFGSNLGKLTTKNIVVFNPTSWKKTDNPDHTLGDIPGLNGASFGDLSIIPVGAQGRMQGIKTALNPVHMANLHSLYSGAGKQPLKLQAASGIKGSNEKVEFTEDTKLLISTEDIKDFERRFAGKNNKEITEAILHDIQAEGLSIKTTFEDADKSSRWMSWQLAQTLEMSDEDQQLFNKVFMEEFALADTLGGAVDSVFAGNQTMQDMLKDNPQLMESPFVKAQISDYRMNMLRRKSRGDILLPKNVKSHRQMFAPWIFNVMNESLLAAADGEFKLPEFLKELSLKDDQVASLTSWAKKLSVARFPATIGSIQLVDNVANNEYLNEKGALESLKKIAAFVGLDPEALYFNPNSSILAALQGADFDGDVGEIIEFAADDKNDYNAVMQHIIKKTEDSHRDQIKLGKLTEEDSKKKLEQLQHTLQNENRTWSTTNGQDVAKYILHAAQSSSRMGSANAVTRNAFQMDRAQNFVSEALVDAYHRYDKNSTSAKKGVMMEPSKRELEVLGYGAPFAEFFRFVDKNGRDDQNNIDIGKLKERNPNFFKYNLPTKYSSGSVLSAMTTRYLAKQQYGDDVVTEDYNWNKIFDGLYGEAKMDTAVDRMQYGLRQAYLGFLNSDYLALSDEDASWLAQLKKEAYDEVFANQDAYATQLETYKRDDSSNRPEALIMRMLNDLGGKTIDHLIQDGLIESVLNGEDYNFILDAITGSGFGSGVSSLYKTHSQTFEKLKMSPKFQEQVEANRRRVQQEREHRLKFYDGYGPEKKHEIAKAIDDHKFSYSDLKLFADKPEDWLRYVMDPKTRPEYQTTDATEIGKVSHMIIQDYFEKRENLIKQRANDGNQFQFTEEDIAKLEQHDGENLGDYFHRMLRDGYTPPNGSKYEKTTKLNSDVLKSLQEGSKGGTLQEQYNGVRDFITRNMHAVLTEMINPEEWEFVPTKSEKPLSFKNAQLGNQINQPDNPVNVTGRADLVFRKRHNVEGAEDEYFIVDMKNFGKGMSEQDADHMRNQLYIYALADEFRKQTAAGENPAEVASQVTRMGFLLPAQQEFREVDASPEALEEAHGKYQTAIAEIQSLAETGLLDNYINQLKRSIGASLFGSGSAQHVDKEWKEKFSKELEAAQEAYYADEKAKYTNNELSGATIGKTLVLHEDYKEYMDNVHGVAKFANKQLSQYGQSQDYNVWESNAKRIAEAKEQARTLQLRGMTEEANRQDSDAQYAEKQFDKALKEAAPKALKEAQDLLRQINNEEKPSKGLTEKLEQYQELKQHIENAAKASKYLNAEIEQYTKEANAENTKIDNSKKKLDEQKEHLEDRKKAQKEAIDAKDKEAVERTTKEIESAQEKYNAEKAQHDEAAKKLEEKNSEIAARKEAQTEAAKNKESLDREAKLFEKKFKDDVLKYWEQVGTEFDQTRALTPQSKTASIQDLISGYKNSVINELAAMDNMVKDGKYDWFTEDSDLYKEQRAALQKHLDPSKVSEYQKNLIGRALTDAEQWNNANYATLTGEELDPRIAASMQAKTIAERIAAQKRSFEEQFKGVKLDAEHQTRYDAIKKLLDSFNEEDQVNKLTARAEFDQAEKAARDAYSLQADKQKQEDAIAAWRERIAARQSGKPYSPAAQQEREFQARMAAEEEQLRRYEAEAQRNDATASDRANAQARADSTRQYINDMRTLHAEELRVGATADLRDLNASFEKQISRQGMSSAAISYAEQFDQLAKSIENASLKYDELKKKIEEQKAKGETPDAADLQALTDAETEKAKAEANAKILKENQMDQQRTSNTARVDAFYNQFSAARTPIDGKAAPKWTEGQANRLKELEDRASWSNFHSIQEKERQDLLSRHQQRLTIEEGSEWSALLRKKNKPLSPNEIKELNAQEQREADYKSVTAEERKFVETGEAQQKQDIRDGKIKEDDGRTSGYFKQEDRDRYNDIKRRLTRGLSPEEADRKAALTKKRDNPFTEQEQAKWDDYERRRQLRLTPKELDRLKELTAAYEANGLTPEKEAELKALQQTQRDIQSASTTAVFGSIPVKNFDSRVSDAAKQADQTRKQLISDLKAEKTDTKDAVRQSEIQAQIDGLESVSLEQMEQYYRQQFAEESNRVTENNAYRVKRLEMQGRRMDRDKYGMRDRSIFGRADRQRLNMRDQYEDRIDQIQIEKTELQKHQNSSSIAPEDYSKTSAQIAKLNKQLAEAQKGFKAFDSDAATVKIGLNELGQSASRVIAQFGRQLFHKALQEAKQFVMEFDSAMTEIQMITLKTDDEIEKLGDQLIKTSMNMKVSVSDVTSAASDLYRQGLSDDEVSVRLEDVIKFAKVAGIKTEEASKIITTALSNGLVDSSAEAMDALVALGDSAATTASEISKGMQKTAASAKEAGVSYEQLVTMLTIVTSKTQLGGSSAGTALSTLFYRLQKVGSNESFYDENGTLVANTATSRALKNIGVDLFNEDGSFRGAYDVLVDIAKNWEGASDIQQSAVLSSLGAGRQRSNIATLIQGLSEDDGALADKYLNLAANSDGITDKKYAHYLDTLQASLTNVTNAFDKLVESFSMVGVSTGFFDWITDAISGLASFNEMANGAAGAVVGLTVAVGALALAFAANPVLGWAILGVGGALQAISGIGGLYEQSQIDHTNMLGDQTYHEAAAERVATSNKLHAENEAILDETEALLELREAHGLTAEESEKLDKNMKELERRFGTIDDQINVTSASYKDLIRLTKEYRTENDKIREQGAKDAFGNFRAGFGSNSFKQTINDTHAAIGLRNDEKAQEAFSSWFEGVAGKTILTSEDMDDPTRMQFIYSMINNGPWGKQETESGDTVKAMLLKEGALDSVDALGKHFQTRAQSRWGDFAKAVTQDTKGLSMYNYLDDKLSSSSLTDQYAKDLETQLNSYVPLFEDIMSATSATPEQVKTASDTWISNILSNPAFYSGSEEEVQSIIQKEIDNLLQLIFTAQNEFNPTGLDDYNKRYSFNGQTDLTAGELEAAKQRYIVDSARQFLKTNNLYIDSDTIKGKVGAYDGEYFEDDAAGFNAVALANAWRQQDEASDDISFTYDTAYNPFVLPKVQAYDPSSSSSDGSSTNDAKESIANLERLLQAEGEEDPKRQADHVIDTQLKTGVRDLNDVYALIINKTLDLSGLLTNFPEIKTELAKYAIYDADNNLVGFEDDVDAFMYILDMIAGVSSHYSGSTFATMRERAVSARQTWKNFQQGSSSTNGNTKWLQDIIGNDLYWKMQEKGIEGISSDETLYIDTLLSNASYGVKGLTEYQRFQGAADLFERSKDNDFSDFMDSNDSGMISDYASAIEGGADYFHAAELLSEQSYASGELAGVEEGSEDYAKITEILEGAGYSLDTFLEKQKEIDKEIKTKTLRLFKEYGDSTENVIANFEQWDGKASDVASAMSEFNSVMSKAQRNAWLRTQANGDNWTDDVVAGIAEMTGYSKEYIEEHKEDVKGLFETYEKADRESVQEEMRGLDEAFSAGLNDSQWALEVHPDIKAQLASGYNLDFSQVGNQLKGYVSDAFLAEVQNAVNSGVTGYVHVTQDADGKVHAQLVVEGINSSSYTPPPRGGGGKSAADKLLESHNREQTIRDHIIKMIQYEESMYQNAGQLTNYGIMLQHEIDEEKRQAAAKKEQIAVLEKQISKTKKYSDDWYTLRDAIMKAEEEYEKLTNTIEENNKKLAENQQAILKLHTELEQTVKQEIETRIKEERDMLSGTVSMQSVIIEAIRERYREEWELMQKDIEKKRKALEEEKALIDERLNRRKEAEDEAKKHEELAEYQKQLALISMDPTRTSDVATLREKIQALEEELAWDLAEDEAKMQQDALQDQIDAYDQYKQEYQEWLDEYLKDANNFADEVNHVMGLGHDELMQWLKDNVTEFGNSLEAAQEQMIQGWGDTFKQMKGIVDTYWDEINKVLSSKENFIAYMQESSSYKNASEDEKKQMLYNWGKAYDDYIAASVVSDEAVNYEHSDEFKGSSSKKSNTKKDKAPAATPESRYELLSLEEEIKQSLAKKTFAPIAKFAEGGLVDYTGPAWVDGTKTKPEAFLDAEDTSLLRAMLDGWKHVRNLPFMSNVSGVAEHGDGMSIGEVNVTLNEAQFNTDDDYETIAQKVGAAFTKELAKQGFSTARYAF